MTKSVIVDGRLLDLKKNTGISRYTEFICKYYIEKGYDLTLILNDGSNKILGCKILKTDLRPYNIVDFYKYPSFIETLHFDLLHIPFYSGLFRRPKNLHGRIIITVHDLMYKIVPDFFGKNHILNGLKRRYFDFIIRKTLKTSDTVISVSETTNRDLLRLFRKNSTVIPEHSEISKKNNDSILTKFGLKSKEFYFYCGNNRSHKNISFIRRIFGEKYSEYPLVLSGKGHNNGRNIIATGIISDEELKSLYVNAKGFIFPSSYEGFGLPILESLHSHTPIICSDIPAFKEFRSQNIEYFKINDTETFLKAINKNNNKTFKDNEELLSYYSIEHIYSLFDSLLQSL